MSRKPLNDSEYSEFRKLSALTETERGATGHARYLELKFRYMLHSGKKR